MSCHCYSSPTKLFQKIAFKTNCASTVKFANGKLFESGTLDSHGIKQGDILYVDYYKPEDWRGQMYVTSNQYCII